jgi:predicted short-subunit dehydrogenase-like oxidoreductase (DUF2520 family)
MKFAVAGGGRVSASFVARLPRLASELGPVAAQSYRLASRIANTIGAGRPVRRYAELNECPLILICAPAAGVPRIAGALAQEIDCRRKTVLLCETGAESAQLAGLKARGAGVGSIDAIPGVERRFVAEGDPAAVREAKSLARQIGGRVEEIDPAKTALYGAGLSFGTSLFTPLMEAATQCFLDAGMSKASAMRVVAGLFQSTLRGYGYAGKRSWSGPLAGGKRDAVRREISALEAARPALARLYREMEALAGHVLKGSS